MTEVSEFMVNGIHFWVIRAVGLDRSDATFIIDWMRKRHPTSVTILFA